MSIVKLKRKFNCFLHVRHMVPLFFIAGCLRKVKANGVKLIIVVMGQALRKTVDYFDGYVINKVKLFLNREHKLRL